MTRLASAESTQSLRLWLAVAAGFLVAELAGFSIGRYLVVLPLALTAYGVSRKHGIVWRVASTAAAIGLWTLFSFVLFGVVLLESGFLIEFGICMAALVLSWFLPALLRPHSL